MRRNTPARDTQAMCAERKLEEKRCSWNQRRPERPKQRPAEPRDGGSWRAAVCGAAQSQTRLKRLSSSSSSVLFTSVCSFFSSSKSLANLSCIFSILFLRYWIIFTIIILIFFSGILLISTSFSYFSGALSCSLI